MCIHNEKLKNIVVFLYVKEAVGKALYEEIHLYPQLQQECTELSNLAMEYETLILSKQAYQHLKQPILEKVLSIHNISIGIEKYRQSRLFFDESGNITDLI